MNYFDKGEFEKALVSFQDLLTSQPGNGYYFQKTVECYQQLKQKGQARHVPAPVVVNYLT